MGKDYKVLVLSLNVVLLQRPSQKAEAISSEQLRLLANCNTYWDLERGAVSLDEACKHFSGMIDVSPAVIKDTLDQVHRSLTVNEHVSDTVRRFKKSMPGIEIYGVSNMAREHYTTVEQLNLPWCFLKHIFVSSKIGKRIPELQFFDHVIDSMGVTASEIVMIDSDIDTICVARSKGIHGMLYRQYNMQDVGQRMWNVFQDHRVMADEYMLSNAKTHHSVVEVSSGIVLKDNFAQLLILGILGRPELVYFKWPCGKMHNLGDDPKRRAQYRPRVDSGTSCSEVRNGLWNYFSEGPILTTKDFPPDADTTSTAYLNLPDGYLSELPDVALVLEEMANNTNPDGIMQTYFCKNRPRITPEVCVNILRVFYRFAGSADVRIKKSEDWVVDCLRYRACLYGNRHYSTPESFLYFAAKLWEECKDAPAREGEMSLRARLDSVKEVLREHINTPANPMALAMRISACQTVGFSPRVYQADLRRLILLQQEDGGFPAGHFCCFGRTGGAIGSRGLTTALSIQILRREEERKSSGT